MSEEEISYLPYELALRVVAAIQEEEDCDNPNRRVLTVYSHQDKEICWFNFDEVMQDVGITKADADSKELVTKYIMNHIPEWVMDI